MSEQENQLLTFQPEHCDRDKLNKNARALQELVRSKNTEIADFRYHLYEPNHRLAYQRQARDEELPRVRREGQVTPDSLSQIQDADEQESQFHALDTHKWVRAEKDYPDDTPCSCFPRRYRTALVYDPYKEHLSICSVEQLQGKHAIISRLPSRWSTAIHVYAEGVPTSPNYRVRVTTKERVPMGMVPFCTIHPRKLSTVKLRILLGQIQWLFIIRSSSWE